MIAEKPSWIRHEGLQIFSIDIQPGGLRFATGGGDHKVISHSFFAASFLPFVFFLLLFPLCFGDVSEMFSLFVYLKMCCFGYVIF